MHFLVMSPCSRDFLLMSLYIYSNKMIMNAWFLDSKM